MNYGIPYMGSKNTIVGEIVSSLPYAETLVDLFGGGGAISHAAALSGKFGKIIYNDIDLTAYKGFKMAVEGGFRDEERWISRDEFFRLKDTDPYATICFSFGNNARTYAYSPANEEYKHALHRLIFWKEVEPLYELMQGILDLDDLKRLTEIGNRRERRLKYRQIVLQGAANRGLVEKRGAHYYLKPLGQINQLESLERLERMQGLKIPTYSAPIEFLNLDYRKVEIPPGAVVYCDIPYKSKQGYNHDLDYDAFYDWALSRPFTVYVSEYDMPQEFICLGGVTKKVSLSSTSSGKAVERLFTNRPEGLMMF